MKKTGSDISTGTTVATPVKAIVGWREWLTQIDTRDAQAFAAELLRLPTVRERESRLAGASPAAASL